MTEQQVNQASSFANIDDIETYTSGESTELLGKMGIDFCNETERLNYRLLFAHTRRDFDIKPLYTYLCPVIMFVCFFSIIFNAILMSISRQSTVINKSPILLLSLNLAVTDLIASLMNGLGILFNSYLPEVHDISLGQCSMLMFEVVRCAALVASALHLLALAFVHYRGIVNPLHYRSTIFFSQHLSRTINIISIACWIIPLTIMLAWFSSSPCQGFQSAECDYLFLLGFTYRYMVLTLFALPLLLMSAIYLRIFIIISRHQKGRRQNDERSALSRGVLTASAPIGSAAAVNLPELIAISDSARCAACAARALQDDDEFTVSVLGEETVEEAVEDEQDEEEAVCRCNEYGKEQRVLALASKSTDTPPEAAADGVSLSSGLSLRLTLTCRQQALKAEDKKQICIPANGSRFKLLEEPVRRQSIVQVADGTAGVCVCDDQDSMACTLDAAATTIVYNKCDITDGKRAPSSGEEAAGAPVAANLLESLGVEVVLIKAEPARSDSLTCSPCGSRSLARRVGYTSGSNTETVNATLRKQLDKSADPREAERSVRVESAKTVSLVHTEDPSCLDRESCAAARSLGETRQLASYKNNVGPPRVTVKAQVSLGGVDGLCINANRTNGEHRTLTSPPDNGLSRCQTGRQSQRYKCGLHRTAHLSLDHQTRQRSNLISRDCTCDNNKSGRFKLSRANTISTDSSCTNTSRGTKTTATITTNTANTTTPKATTSERSSISSSATTVAANSIKPLGRSGYFSSGGHIRQTVRSLASGSGLGSLAAHAGCGQDNKSNAASNSFAITNSPSYEPQRRHMHASAVPQTNTKALVTTLLILGTYFISYVPAIIFQVLTCIDNCPYPLYTISFSRRLLFGALTTLLLIAKSIIDPFIYSYRMNEIQVAIGRYLSKRRSKSSHAPTSMQASQRHNTLNSSANHANLNSNHHHHHRNPQSLNAQQRNSSSNILNNSSNKSSLRSANQQSTVSSRAADLQSKTNSQRAKFKGPIGQHEPIRDNDVVKWRSEYNVEEAHELFKLIKPNEEI